MKTDTAVIPLSVQPETETPASLVDYFKGIEDNQVQSSEKQNFHGVNLKRVTCLINGKRVNKKNPSIIN